MAGPSGGAASGHVRLGVAGSCDRPGTRNEGSRAAVVGLNARPWDEDSRAAVVGLRTGTGNGDLRATGSGVRAVGGVDTG